MASAAASDVVMMVFMDNSSNFRFYLVVVVPDQRSQLSGVVTISGNNTSSSNTMTWDRMNGRTPYTTLPRGTRDTPLTTLSTTPTGGVISEIQVVITNMM